MKKLTESEARMLKAIYKGHLKRLKTKSRVIASQVCLLETKLADLKSEA
jgi:hypothetical protein